MDSSSYAGEGAVPLPMQVKNHQSQGQLRYDGIQERGQ